MHHKHYQKIPHWSVGDKVFYHKLEALEHCSPTKEDLRFWFFDEAFDALDWTQEPETDWRAMMAQRARQLRESYDVLRLYYSGGVDSQTMLNIFLEEGIFIDEIFCYRQSPVDKFDDDSNWEINGVAIPFLKSIEARLGKTKIIIRDLGFKEYNAFFTQDGWCYKTNSLDFRIPACGPEHTHTSLDEHYQILETEKKVCKIKGDQKPRLRKRNNSYYAYFPDSALSNDVGSSIVEMFYLTPDFPELHLKQCHLLKNRVKKIHPDLENIDHLFRFKRGNDFLDHWNGSCRDPLWRGISLGKSETIFTPKALLYLESAKQADPRLVQLLNNYQGAIDEEADRKLWRFNDENPYKQMQGIIWKEFYLGE